MSRRLLCAVAVAAALAALASTIALAAVGPDTTATVSSKTILAAPSVSPVDAPGVRAVRAGKPLPAGYALIGHRVTITRGAEAAWVAMRLACPAGKHTRTLAMKGDIGPQLVGRYHSTYVSVIGDYASAVKRGQTVTGTIYLLCR